MNIPRIAKKADTTPAYVTKFLEKNKRKLTEKQLVEQIRTDISLSILKTLPILEFTTNKTKDELMDALHITREQLETDTIKNMKLNMRLRISHMDTSAEKIATIRKNIMTYIIENGLYLAADLTKIDTEFDIVDNDAFEAWREKMLHWLIWPKHDSDKDPKNEDFVHEYKELIKEILIEKDKLDHRYLELPNEILKLKALFGSQLLFLRKLFRWSNTMRAILINTAEFTRKQQMNREFTNSNTLIDALIE